MKYMLMCLALLVLVILRDCTAQKKEDKLDQLHAKWEELDHVYDSLQAVPDPCRDSAWYARKAWYFRVGDSLVTESKKVLQ